LSRVEKKRVQQSWEEYLEGGRAVERSVTASMVTSSVRPSVRRRHPRMRRMGTAGEDGPPW
jgi:hypothetical protein